MTDEQKPAPQGTNPEPLFAAIDSIDLRERKISVCDADQIIHPLVWEPTLDHKMANLKPSYYKKFTVKKEGDATRVISFQWIEKQDIPAWVAQRYKNIGGRGGGGAPKNDRAIIFEVAYQEMHATFRQWLEIQTEPPTFEQLMTWTDTISGKAQDHAKAMIEGAGVG